jgi:hypothetical protein
MLQQRLLRALAQQGGQWAERDVAAAETARCYLLSCGRAPRCCADIAVYTGYVAAHRLQALTLEGDAVALACWRWMAQQWVVGEPSGPAVTAAHRVDVEMPGATAARERAMALLRGGLPALAAAAG